MEQTVAAFMGQGASEAPFRARSTIFQLGGDRHATDGAVGIERGVTQDARPEIIVQKILGEMFFQKPIYADGL